MLNDSDQQFYDDMHYHTGAAGGVSAKELISKGWRKTYSELFGQSFVDVLASHHIASIEWHWNARIDILEGRKPEYYADFPMWSRGHMKSTIARRVAVIDAFLSFAYSVGGYCLYFSGTDDKTNKHALSISQLLQSKSIQKYAPGLAKVKRSDEGSRSLGWKATFIYTDAGYVFHFGSLQSGLAGGNVDDLRPSLMIPDDIDDRKDSPAIAERNLKAFTLEILPMGKTGTLTFFAQNLISRFSIMYRIYKNHLSVLTNRRPSEPVKAVENIVIEYRTENGIIKPFIVAGQATWEQGMPISACEEELQRIGEPAFRSECLHEVEQSREGLILYNYDDFVHPTSYSQFAAIYGSQTAWKDWYKVIANDYARTKTKFHANVAGYFAVSSQNTKLPGHTFLIPMSFKANTAPEDMADRFLTELTPFAYGETTWKELINEAWKRLNPSQHFDSISERLDYLKSYYAQIIPKYAKPVLSGYNVRVGVISHSEDKLREGFNTGFGFSFQPSNPGKNDAIEDMNMSLKVDYSEPHCFDVNKKGYTRFHVLCPDDLSQEPTVINGVKVYPPVPFKDELQADNLHDSDLFRYQMLNCRNRDPKLTELGENIDEPLKLHDDYKQMWQMVVYKRLLANIALNTNERVAIEVEAKLPEAKLEEIKQSNDAEYVANAVTHRNLLEMEIRDKIKQQNSAPKPAWQNIG